ncbi:MAG: phage tail protein [Spirochaetes bacterium]|nr:phage tail protein [Spirochaetota bacterium]
MNNNSNDSLFAKYFSIELEGIESAKFLYCEGLEAYNAVFEINEGGLNTNSHKFIGKTKYPNIILKNGVTENSDLIKWFKETTSTDKKIERKNGSIIMYNPKGEEIKRWNFFRAIPCRWIGPLLDFRKRAIAIESMEIAHEGLEIDDN